MRTIDADAFAQFIRDTIKKQKYDSLICHNLTVGEILDNVIAELEGTGIDGLKNAPTVEPEPDWTFVSKGLPKKNGVYLVYAPDYDGGSSRGKEKHDGVMFSAFRNGKWGIEHGYYKRPNCVRAWKPFSKPSEEVK